MVTSKRVLVIVCGVCILAYLVILSQNDHQVSDGKSTKNATASPFMHMDGLIKSFVNKMVDRSSKAIQVLVLTYMRSGSSLTGDILQHASGSFYLYEPLRMIEKALTFEQSMALPDGDVRKPPFTFQKETYDALYNWFTCNISNIPVIGLTDPFLNKGIKSKMFPLCYQKQKTLLKSKTSAIRMCARKLQRICSDSPFRIIKTIRIQLHDIKHLLEDLPYLKIIHLVRDPRATLSSQAQLGMCSSWRGGQIGCTNLFCKRLENDVLEEERLLKRYPGRIMPIFYEDIAKNPLEISKKMYDFIGADFTLEAQEYIYNITMAGNENNCVICTTRSNSTEHIDSWKKTMKIDFVNIVNERCNYVLKRYGFDKFPTT